MVSAGVGLTEGYLRAGKASRRLFAAIPLDPDGSIEIAYLESDLWDGSWRRMEEVFPGGKVATQARPALAYVPYPRGDVSDGRFYLAWNPPADEKGRKGLRIAKTEGNNTDEPANYRRFRFLNPLFASNKWLYATGAVDMRYDASFDENPRLAFTFQAKDERSGEVDELETPVLYPYADGVVDTWLRDTDDYCYMLAYMACALTRSCDSSIPVGQCE